MASDRKAEARRAELQCCEDRAGSQDTHKNKSFHFNLVIKASVMLRAKAK